MAVVQPAPDSSISEVICTNLDYAQYSCAPKRGEHGDGHHGFQNKAWPLCLMRLGSVRAVVRRSSVRWRSRRRSGTKRPIWRLRRWACLGAGIRSDRRARQGSGLVTDLVPGQSGGGKGKGRLPEPVERVIRATAKAVPDQAEAQPSGLSPRSHSGVQGSNCGAGAQYRGLTDR